MGVQVHAGITLMLAVQCTALDIKNNPMQLTRRFRYHIEPGFTHLTAPAVGGATSFVVGSEAPTAFIYDLAHARLAILVDPATKRVEEYVYRLTINRPNWTDDDFQQQLRDNGWEELVTAFGDHVEVPE